MAASRGVMALLGLCLHTAAALPTVMHGEHHTAEGLLEEVHAVEVSAAPSFTAIESLEAELQNDINEQHDLERSDQTAHAEEVQRCVDRVAATKGALSSAEGQLTNLTALVNRTTAKCRNMHDALAGVHREVTRLLTETGKHDSVLDSERNKFDAAVAEMENDLETLTNVSASVEAALLESAEGAGLEPGPIQHQARMLIASLRSELEQARKRAEGEWLLTQERLSHVAHPVRTQLNVTQGKAIQHLAAFTGCQSDLNGTMARHAEQVRVVARASDAVVEAEAILASVGPDLEQRSAARARRIKFLQTTTDKLDELKAAQAGLGGNVSLPVRGAFVMSTNFECSEPYNPNATYSYVPIGVASYHFDSPTDVYMHYCNHPLGNLDDGSALPPKKAFNKVTYDPSVREMRGKIDWSPTTFDGISTLDYVMRFTPELDAITEGHVTALDKFGRTVGLEQFGCWHYRRVSLDKGVSCVDSFPVRGVFVQSPDLHCTGNSPDETAGYRSVGHASIHLDSPSDIYVRFCDKEEAVLDDGTPLPDRKMLVNTSFDSSANVLSGLVDWSPTSLHGVSRVEYTLGFTGDHTAIESGEVRAVAPSGATVGEVPVGCWHYTRTSTAPNQACPEAPAPPMSEPSPPDAIRPPNATNVTVTIAPAADAPAADAPATQAPATAPWTVAADAEDMSWQMRCAVRFAEAGGCEEDVFGTAAADAKIPWGCFRPSAQALANWLCSLAPEAPPAPAPDACTLCVAEFQAANGCAVWGQPAVHDRIPHICASCDTAEDANRVACGIVN